MEHYTSASVEILGSVLRYAEVERDGDIRRLVRLGSCDFDFDLEDAVRDGARAEWLDTISHAVQDILAGSAALDLHIALHPPLGSSLFVPVPAETPKADRLKQLWQDVAVAYPGQETAFSAELIRAEVLADGDSVNWWHLLNVSTSSAETLERVLAKTEVARRRFCASMSGAAAVLRLLAREKVEETPVATPYRIAIGSYETHTEYVLMQNQAWQFSSSSSACSTVDRIYQLRLTLDGLEVPHAEIAEAFVYGKDRDEELSEAMSAMIDRPVRPLNPLSVVEHHVDGLSPGFNFESYAPCVGANLRDVYS